MKKITYTSFLSQLLLLLFVIIWIIPTFGLFISSLRDKDLLAISGWWTSLTTTEINEIYRMSGMASQTQEGDYFVIKGKLFENNTGKKIQNFGITSKKINEFEIGEVAIFKDTSKVTIDENGNYLWKSLTEFKKKKGKRIFTTSLSPPSFTFDNYKEVLFKEGIGRAFINTLAVALPSTLIPLIICSFFAYALTWMKFFGRDTLLAIIIASLVVPLQMSLIPILTIYNDFGALFGVAAKSYPGVWMAHTGFGLASTTFLLRNFLKSLPNEMMEAAKVDGASHYDIFLKIILPLSIPAFASIFILQFLWCWNDLLVGLVFLDQVPSEIILTAKLKELLGSRGENWEILTTGAFVSMTIPLFIFFALQRYFIRGLVAGSVKG
ncbi:MAG: carbohydrate ABC transporter permease [Alphaproteobacteria bacterium]